jgi:biopolymer transport protein ExbB
MADVKKTTTTATSAAVSGGNQTSSMMFNTIAVAICVAIAVLLYMFVLGAPGNFDDPLTKHKPKTFLGTMYVGGVIVPILMSMLFILVTFTIERFMTIFKAKGKMGNAEFIKKIQYHLSNKNIDAALAECDNQKGSVGNVMKAGLKKYALMANDNSMNQEQKLAVITKEVEEATSLELPMLEKNLVFLSTISSGATLLGLLGTVIGMIKAFRAMAKAGAPDPNELANGISEALINTALGIGTSFIAIIAYNFFTTIIDNVTYGIDESGFTLTQSFKANYAA